MTSCFQLISPTYFVDMTAQIDSIETAADLQALVDNLYPQLSLTLSTMTAQIALLAPMAVLANPVTNLAGALTFISHLQSTLIAPLVIPSVEMPLQIAAITAQITTMTAAIEALASTKFPGVTITIPPIDTSICTIP